MRNAKPPLPWLAPGDPFPPVSTAWGSTDPVPGLLAAGGALTVDTLLQAYSKGIFPWFSQGQPTLWWSPDPRMVLQTNAFHMRRSLRKTLRRFITTPCCEIRFNTAFTQVIASCATSPRPGQSGTWIVPTMMQAYTDLHNAGYAHSVETWIDDRLAGGLYCVSVGKAVFGESMFTRTPDASKIALAALVVFCRRHDLPMIDCQQNTAHLASMGAREVSRASFIQRLEEQVELPTPPWRFDPVYWRELPDLLPPTGP